MNSDAANALVEGLTKFGEGMARDARLCRSVLSDLVPHRKREIRILSTAVEEGAPAELLARATNTPETVLVESLSKRLHNHHGIDLELARWAVQSWSSAIKRANLSAATSAAAGAAPSARKAPPTQSQPQVVRVLMVLGLLMVLVVGTGVWMAVKLLNAPEKPVAIVDPRPPVVEPGTKSQPPPETRDAVQPRPAPAPKAPEPSPSDRPTTVVVPQPKATSPDTSKPKTTTPPLAPDPAKDRPTATPSAVEPKKPTPPPPVDPRIALREQLRRKSGELESVQQPLETRLASLRKQLSDTQTDIKERKKLLSYLERAYQRATDEQRWPMRASGFTYSQPNAKRAIETIGTHLEKQSQSVAALEPLIQSLAALSMEGGMLKGDIDCLSGARSEPGCARVELTKSSVDTLLRRADDFQKRVDATPKANPPISTLDLSKIPQP